MIELEAIAPAKREKILETRSVQVFIEPFARQLAKSWGVDRSMLVTISGSDSFLLEAKLVDGLQQQADEPMWTVIS